MLKKENFFNRTQAQGLSIFTESMAIISKDGEINIAPFDTY